MATTTGTKGSDVYDGTGSALLNLSVKMVRGATDLIEAFDAALAENFVETVVLLFHARNVRGGKGERTLSLSLLERLATLNPKLMPHLLPLWPQYGSWRDMRVLMDGSLCSGATMCFATKLREDTAALAEGEKPSLCAKWAPREGKSSDQAARALAKYMFRTEPIASQLARYRRLISPLNKALKTVEIAMSARTFASIEPKTVPGRAGKIYGRAFLNLESTYRDHHLATARQLTRSQETDRQLCAEHFEAFYKAAAEGKVVMNGSDTLFPHEILKATFKYLAEEKYGDSPAIKDLYRAMWAAQVKAIKESGGLKDCIMMGDFSGSMTTTRVGDTPYWVSMAMCFLGAELTGRFMGFDSNPAWCTFPEGCTDLFDRIKYFHTLGIFGQGLSTDFQKAMELVLTTLKAREVGPERKFTLVCVTDMNWDAACRADQASLYTGNTYQDHVKTKDWQTHHQMIEESFKAAGLQTPHIVVWNVAPNPTDFHALADAPGISMLSGWSPSVFKTICASGPLSVKYPTPLDTLLDELRAPMYDPIRSACASRDVLSPALHATQTEAED
jgi:imidazoleglycerol phosphate dehydratase HisB